MVEASVDRPLDVVIVGAGTAGLAALREVRKRTDRFALVNDGPYGTTCARVGCMPSKALIAAADALHARVKLDEFGIRGGDGLRTDLPAVLARVRALRDHSVAGVLETTADLGARNIAGRARLDGPHRVVVGDRVLHARRIVLAPGSSPVVPAPWQALGDRVLTTDTLFEQADLPPRVGVIGLGAIGVEIAQALARFGIDVHGFDAAERVAGLSDPTVEGALRAALEDEFRVRLGVQVEPEADAAGVAIGAGAERVVVDRVLVAVGRRPNVADLGLETLGVRLDERGMPEVDPETMRIGDTPVLLAGDAAGVRPLLHEAADDAGGADGLWGPQSRGAMMAFQQSQGLEATGLINLRSLEALGLTDLAAQLQGQVGPGQATAAPGTTAEQPGAAAGATASGIEESMDASQPGTIGEAPAGDAEQIEGGDVGDDVIQ